MRTYINPISVVRYVAAQQMLCASGEPVLPSTTILNEAANFSGAAPQRVGGRYF